MIRKLTLATAFGAGYVLGARAGRERYEQIASSVQGLAAKPPVRRVTDSATAKAGDLAEAAKDKAEDLTAQAKDKASALATDAVETAKEKAGGTTAGAGTTAGTTASTIDLSDTTTGTRGGAT